MGVAGGRHQVTCLGQIRLGAVETTAIDLEHAREVERVRKKNERTDLAQRLRDATREVLPTLEVAQVHRRPVARPQDESSLVQRLDIGKGASAQSRHRLLQQRRCRIPVTQVERREAIHEEICRLRLRPGQVAKRPRRQGRLMARRGSGPERVPESVADRVPSSPVVEGLEGPDGRQDKRDGLGGVAQNERERPAQPLRLGLVERASS